MIKARYFWCLLVLLMAIGNAAAQVATDCTLYVSPSGSGNGGSPSTATTLTGAQRASTPGAVICMLGGSYSLGSTFYVNHSGTSSAWIVYKAYGDGAVNINWTGPSGPGNSMIHMGQATFPNGPHYIEFNGLNLDGKLRATSGFFCGNGHHLRFLNNSVKNTGGAGIAAVQCDYVTSDHNLMFHNGYAPCCGWTSAISYNSNQFLDSYPGLHSIISNNIVAGEFDSSTKHTDGNGIILDRSCPSSGFCQTVSSAHTPPVLIMNNVVYMNGGKCIIANIVSDFYVINNTCYKNGLDLLMTVATPSEHAERKSKNGWFVNNIGYAWGGQSGNYSYDSDAGGSTNISYYRNMWFVRGLNFTPSQPSQFFNQDPLFMRAPPVNPIQGNQEALALDPSFLGIDLTLQTTSPAIHKGIDPSTIPGLPTAIVTDLRKYVYADINGNSRSVGSWDLGAYQSSAGH
jgi:hypothetical protein